MRQTQIFSGSSHPKLVDGICERLGTQPASAHLGQFANGETRVEIQTSIREQDVFLVQSGSNKINDAVLELLIMASACKGGSAKSITAVMPYFPYSRQSKKKSHRGAITARMVANLLNVAGVNHVITLDLHATQMQGFFKCPVDNLIAEPLIARWIKHNTPDWQKAVVVSKNAGGTKRVTSLADALKLSFGIVATDRRRLHLDSNNFSVNGSVLLEKFPDSDLPVEEALTLGESQLMDMQQTNGSDKHEEEDKNTDSGHSRKGSNSRRRATSNVLARRMYNQSVELPREIPSSPLSKSMLVDRSASSSPIGRSLMRVNTAPEAPLSHDEDNTEEFFDHRVRDVVHARFWQGHIQEDNGSHSPSMSAVSGRSRHGLHHRTSSSDDDDVEVPPYMMNSFMSVASSVRRIEEDALGGTVDAAASSEEEEEGLKDPELETMITLVGNVKGRPVLIVDDMIDKAGSWIAAAECCVKRGGATKVYCIATHGLFGEDALQEMEDCDCIDGIVVTNSFPLDEEKRHGIKKLVEIDVSGLLAEAIRRNHHGENISQLYMHWND